MSTSTLGGHVNTISEQMADGRRRRRVHSDEFKTNAVAACQQVGVSIAAVAMSHGINANLLRRWVQASESAQGCKLANSLPAKAPATKAPIAFVPMQLPAPAPTATGEIRIEVRRGAMTVIVAWPIAAATECSAWMRELLG